MHSIDWGDLRYVLAVANAGSAAAAARALKVNHATVIRRLRSFEKAQGLRIFDHLASGYRLTPEGEVFLDAARAINDTVTELERKTAGGGQRLCGSVRVTTTDGLMPLLADSVADFHHRYPQLKLELLITNHALNLDTLDAELAIRPTASTPATLSGRRVCDLAFGVYAAPALRQDERFAPLHAAPWLGLNEPLSGSVPGRWLSATVAEEQITIRCNSFISLLTLAEQGLGYALLPCYLGDGSATLRRVLAEPLPLHTHVWLLSHRDVLRSASVRACRDFFYRRLRRERARLDGSAPGTA